jgi:charged multivesicular body protein 3
LIEEMMDDTFESLEDDDLEEQADQEVEKILWEVTSGKMNTVVYS